MHRSIPAVWRSSLILAIVLILGITLGPASPALAQSLYMVESDADAVVAALLREGFLVSARESGVCLVFGDARLEGVARELGCATRELDRDTRQWEYYLTSGRPEKAPRRSFRRLASVGEASLVAVPAGGVEALLEAGFEVRRLFPRSLRLATEKPRPVTPRGVASEAAIADLVGAVSAESLQANVLRLEGFGTRNARKAGGREAAAWLAARFRGFGIQQVEVRTWTSAYAGNVVATIPGKVDPEAIVLLGGHFDSYAADSDYEPGADDNASGTASLLEIARLLATQRLASTVRIVAFSAEEWGLVGSEVYAATAAAQGEGIVAMLNFDMLGYLAAGDKRDLDLIIDDYGRNEWLLLAAQEAAANFVPELRVLRGKLLRGRSDHESFWAQGYDAIFFFEDSNSPSPFIHTPDDVVAWSYNDTTLHAQSTRVALALTATLAGLQGAVPVTLESFAAASAGDAVRLQWSLFPAAASQLIGVDVERSESLDGPWDLRTASPLPGAQREFVDAAPGSRASWFYRLLLHRQDGGIEASVWVQVRFDLAATRLESVVELEPGGPLQVRYHLGVPAPRLHLGVYDVRGRLVRLLASGARAPGEYVLTWDRRDRGGSEVVNGIYIVQLRAPDGSRARKIVLRR